MRAWWAMTAAAAAEGSIARRCGLGRRASRAAPSRLRARRLRHPSFVDRQVCSPGPALGPLAPVLHTTHVLTRDAAPDLLHRQVVDGVTGDNGQPGRVGCPPARPPVRSSDSTTSREPNDNDHALEPGRDKDGERATARAGRVKQAEWVLRAKNQTGRASERGPSQPGTEPGWLVMAGLRVQPLQGPDRSGGSSPAPREPVPVPVRDKVGRGVSHLF